MKTRKKRKRMPGSFDLPSRKEVVTSLPEGGTLKGPYNYLFGRNAKKKRMSHPKI